MRKLLAVLRHEFKKTAANKAFVVMTILGPFLILAVTVLPTLLARNTESLPGGGRVAILAEPGAFSSAAGGSAGAGAGGLAALSVSFAAAGLVPESAAGSLDEAKARVGSGEIGGVLHLQPGWQAGKGARFYTKTGTEAALYARVEALLGAAARQDALRETGIAPELAARLLAEPELEVVSLKNGGEAAAGETMFMGALFTALSFVMLLYMTTLLYGQLIGRSVVVEKSSKTVEIMLSSVSARELMFGKILGMGLAGLLQYAVWILMGLLARGYVAPLLGAAVPAALSPANFGWLALFFVLAFFLYASAYAALGAAAEDEQHLGQLAWPLLAFLIVPLMLVSSLVMNPDTGLAVGLSLFPMTSPVVMLVRLLVSEPPLWQVALCLALLAAAVPAMGLLAAKVFRVGILMTGKRVKLAEVARWIGRA